MRDTRFKALLIAAQPHTAPPENQAFTDAVMDTIQPHEIISSQLRNMNVNKQETFMKQIKHLPKLAVLAIAVGGSLLLAGGAYAAYNLLWPEPKVETTQQQTTAAGRSALAISFEQCGNSALGERYELKRGATITQADMQHVLKAQCELSLITTWANGAFPHNNVSGRGGPVGEAYESSMLTVGQATTIAARDGDSITFSAITSQNQPAQTFTLTDSVRYLAAGADVAASEIKNTDPVVYITRETEKMTPQPGCSATSCSIESTTVKTELLAVVKLSSDLKYYELSSWQSLTERTTCLGNEGDVCTTGYIGGVEVYQGAATNTENVKEIQGTVTALTDNSFTIRSTSGNLYTITTPTNVATAYNQSAMAQQLNLAVKQGSTLSISYVEAADQHSKALTDAMVKTVYLQTESTHKNGQMRAY